MKSTSEIDSKMALKDTDSRETYWVCHGFDERTKIILAESLLTIFESSILLRGS